VCTTKSTSKDHTFDIAKNFRREAGQEKVLLTLFGSLLHYTALFECFPPQVKQCYNFATEAGEIAAMLCTNKTDKANIVHAIEELTHRKGWEPESHIDDTWPANSKMWEWLWPFSQGRLDIFHWLKRILTTINPLHERNIECRQDLSSKVFNYR